MEILRSRILVRPSDLERSHRFYRDVLGLATYREFGPPDHPGVVFFLGQGLLEVFGYAVGPPGRSVVIWIQVRDVHAEHARLRAAAVPVIRPVGQADHRAPGDHMPSRAPGRGRRGRSRRPAVAGLFKAR